MTAYALRSYPGAAADTTLNGGITSSALGFSVQPGTGSGYPDGTGGEFFVVVDYDNTSTEKMLCIGRAGDAFTVDPDGRGADGTTAFAHGNGAKVRACWTATDAQESNRAAHNTVGQITTKGDLLGANGSTSLVRIPKTSDGTVLAADSSAAGGWSGKALPGLLSGDTLDSLTLTDATLTNPDIANPEITGTVTGSATFDGVALDATSTVDGVTGAQIAADHATTATLKADQTALSAPLSGALGSNATASSGALFTLALGVGTWVVTVAGVTEGTGAGAANILTNPAAGITLTGTTRTGATSQATGLYAIPWTLAFIAVVGTAGSVTVTYSQSGSSVINAAGNTGYVALKVA